MEIPKLDVKTHPREPDEPHGEHIPAHMQGNTAA